MDKDVLVTTVNKALFVLPIPVLAMPITRGKEIAPVDIVVLALCVFQIEGVYEA